jgi:general secretion pathway protein F
MAQAEAVATGRADDLSLDQLIALNDEIAALVRAGIPLERGLLNLGSDFRGRLGGFATVLARRMEQGESLPDALDAEGSRLPRLYRAVIVSGLRSGRLPSALESLANFARQVVEVRRALGLALVYPLVVLLIAYVFFLAFVTQLVPRFLVVYATLEIPISVMLRGLERLGEKALYWGPIVPALFILIGLAWSWSGRGVALSTGKAGMLLGWIPWMRGMLANSRAANFADLLALLVDHDVPFDEAIVLAAESSGDTAIERTARELATALRAGGLPADLSASAPALPPMLRWLIATGHRQGTLGPALRHAAATYRRRALFQADAARAFLPTFQLLLIGATATALFVGAIFYPFVNLLFRLSLG